MPRFRQADGTDLTDAPTGAAAVARVLAFVAAAEGGLGRLAC